MGFDTIPEFKNRQLAERDVHIWSASAMEADRDLARFYAILSDDEIQRAGKFRFLKDRAVYVTAKYLLRSLLGGYLGIPPEELIFDYNAYGKPLFNNKSGIDFNISHSGRRIILGFCTGMTIGVDIEEIKDNFDTFELAGNFFSEEEIEALSRFAKGERTRAFYRCWTRKESFIKAVGEGLSYPLDSFAVSLDHDLEAEFLKIDGIPDHKNTWQLRSFVPTGGYIAALAINGSPGAIEFFDCDAGNLEPV